jgi:hypothetical protein
VALSSGDVTISTQKKACKCHHTNDLGHSLFNKKVLDRETSKKTEELISSADSKSSGPFAVRIREGEHCYTKETLNFHKCRLVQKQWRDVAI